MSTVSFVAMLITILLNSYIFLQTVLALDEEKALHDRVQLHNELNRELRNAICCINKMRCCRKRPGSANIEIRAVLVRCPNTACEGSVLSRRFKKPLYSAREHDIKEFQGFDQDEPLTLSTIRNCRKKLLLTIKIAGSGCNTLKNKYIVVDHVYDPVTKKNTRILTPYVIKLRQEPIMQMYKLKFLHVVNSRVQEEVYNKHDANYTGCDTSSNRPTCGKITYNGKIIPYSQGFCCSCDALKNTKRQPESLNEYTESIISYSDPAYLLDGVECLRNLKSKDDLDQLEDLLKEANKTQRGDFQSIHPMSIPKKDKVKQLKHPAEQPLNELRSSTVSLSEQQDKTQNSLYKDLSYQAQRYVDILNDFIKKKDSNGLNDQIKNLVDLLRPKRQVQSSGAQRRGGQNCADRYTPKGLNPEAYHESTHCLRFSDIWYTVYHLQQPVIENSILFQIFEKHEDMSGHTMWRDITKGKMVRVGTIKKQHLDEKNTISIKYSSDLQDVDFNTFSLNYKSALLMIPEAVKHCDYKKHPELRGGPSEYLIVHPNQISLDGDQCNVAGVGFEAFVKQPNRCSKPKGSCLANQPYNLWRHDHEAQKLGKKGCFFLKHYGNLLKNPIRRNPKTGEQYLVLKYDGNYASTIDFEIKADFNTVLRPQSSARITEVYVDSSNPSKTLLTVKITNSGLTSSSFMTRLTDCPLEIPASFSNIQSKPVLIPPQHQHIFHSKIKCSLPADRFHCSVEALNSKGELVALRRIRLQKFDRCICTWHCLCACVESSEGLKCIPMSLQHYHAAGFQGSLPVTSYLVHYTFLDEILSLFLYIFLFLLLLLLILGLCKALIGICCFPVVGLWGLEVILDLPKPMKKYHEPELSEKRVHYDNEGWPVHPDTKRKVRNVSRSTEFCTNVLFFFAYPLNVSILLLKRVCCPEYDEPTDKHWSPKWSRSSSKKLGITHKVNKKCSCKLEVYNEMFRLDPSRNLKDSVELTRMKQASTTTGILTSKSGEDTSKFRTDDDEDDDDDEETQEKETESRKAKRGKKAEEDKGEEEEEEEGEFDTTEQSETEQTSEEKCDCR